MQHHSVQETFGDRLFTIVNGLVLGLFTLAVLYPLIFVVSASFSSTSAVVSGHVWLFPVDFSLEGYKTVFKDKYIGSGFFNSIYYTVTGTAINVALTVMAAYALSRKDLWGRKWIMLFFVVTMFFNGGLIPNYLLVKNLGMLDTVWSMILPGALSVFNVIIARTYFQTTIPQELLEAAQMDGATDLIFLWKVVIPVSGPIIAVLTLFYAAAHWNAFFSALIYLKQKDLYPLQLVLRDILIQNQVDTNTITDPEIMAAKEGLAELLKYSLIVVSSVPLMIVYPFVQRHFVKGVMVGSVKG
ncbi:carbohydrate ABC transporter permease [Paenibacillus piri]|uniref:Carbohydrate ABC transporter permease n=1 Tax=Paenibacillus piri TaxID=2547395 RepID=A0A4R5KQ76_9BACL|nr:carbohydrate ABC transporter permease [Paenibacillus piri]TDF97482.1 carbohydrate ABC transporter permease [Paenibacillus piri]